MLDLSSIAFKVETKELDDAVSKLGDLQKAVSNLNKPLNASTVATEKLAQAQAKTAKANADAAAATAKAELAQARLEKTTATSIKATSSNTSVLERQQKILEFMTQGFSKGQASILAYAEAAGILDKEMQQLRGTLESQRKLLGSEPFDKSLGAIKVMKNELGALRESQRQYNSGVELTVKQSKDLYREKFRLIEAMKIERDRARELGDTTVSESQRYAKLKQDLRAINTEYVALSKQRNRLADDESLQQNQRRINNLSRGLAPQISDVAVSLYGGMSPMTVLMQQGLQVRDLIQSSGVEAGKLNEVLKKTGADFIGTIGGTFKAVGGLAVGFFQSAGSGVVDFAMKVTGADAMLKAFAKTSDEAAAGVAKFSGIISTAVGATIAVTIATLIALAVAMKQVIQEESALTKAINVTGLSMGLSKDAAVEYAKSFEVIGVSQSKAIGVIIEMAKQGGFTKEAIQSVTKAAIDLEKYAGVSIEKTVDNFAKFQDKPYEALLKVASATGLVTQAQLENIKTLETQGKQAEATAEAIRIYGQVTQAQADLSKLSLSSIETLWIDVKSSIGGAWEEIKNLSRGEAFVNLLSDAFKVVQTVVSTVWYSIKQLNTALGAAAAIAGAMLSGNMSGAIEIGKQFADDWKNAAKNQQGYLDNLWKTADTQNNVSAGLKLTAQQLEKNVVQSKAQAEWEKLTGDLVDRKTKREEGALRIRNQGLAAGKSELEIQKAITVWNEKNKDPKAKKEVETPYQKAIKVFTKDANAATAAQEKYTKAQQDFLDVATSEAWQKFTNDEKQGIVAAAEEAIAREKVVEQIKEQLKAQLELQKVWDATVKAQTALDNRDFDALAASDAKLALLDEELADLILQKAIYGELSVEQKKQIEYAKIKRDLAKELADIENKRSKGVISDDAARELIENAYVDQAKKRQNIDQAIILENIKFESEQRREIANAFGDAIAEALFNGGKAGGKKFKAWLLKELQTRITLQIQANVRTNMQGGGGANQLIQGASNFGSTMSTQGFGSAMSGGFADFADFMADQGFLDFAEGLDSVAGVFSEFAPMVNSTVGYLGAFNTALQGDYGAGIGEALGFYFGGPIGAAIGKEIGSWLGLTDDSGTVHTGGMSQYSAAGGLQTSTEHGAFGMGFGGVAEGEKTISLTSSLSKGIVGILDSTAKAFGKEAGYTAATGFADDTSKDGAWGGLLIKNAKGETQVNWNDSRTSQWAPREFADGEAGAKEYAAAVANDIRGVLITQTPEWADTMLNALGESTTLEDLGKVVTQIHMVNASLKVMGEASVAFAGMSSEMITTMMDKLGGAETTVATLSDYYNKYYTASERAAISQKLMNDQFKALGVTMPSSVEGMRSMVDAAIASGNSGLAAELLKLSGGFYEVANAATEANQAVASERLSLEEKLLAAQGNTTELRRRELEKLDPANRALQQRIWALEDSTKATDAAYNALKAAVEKEKSALNDRIKTIEATASALTSIFNLLKDNVRELYAEVTATSNMQVQQAYAIISNARTTGVLPSQDVLSQAIGTVRGSLDNTNYRTKYEADRARLLFANDLAALQGIAGEQLTEAQQQIKLLKDQIEQYDLILEHAETQINELRGINTSVLSVVGSVDALTAALIAEQEADTAATAAANPPQFAIGGSAPGQANARPPAASTLSRLGNTYYGSLGTAITSAPLVDRYDSVNTYVNTLDWSAGNKGASSAALVAAAQQYGLSSNDLAIATGYSRADIEALTGGQLPRFEKGGYHTGGLRLVGENGPELEVTGPSRIYNASQTASMLSSNSDSDETTMLRAEVRSIAISTSKLQRIIDALVVPTSEGEAINVKVVV